jgi:hypothetical protein
VKRAFQLLWLFCWFLFQIPVLPMMSCFVAEWDNSHQVSLKQEGGMVVLQLKHGASSHQHSAALDLLLKVSIVDGHVPDHQIQFSHGDEVFDSVWDESISRSHSPPADASIDPGAEVFAFHGRKFDFSIDRPAYRIHVPRIVLGLKQTIMII